MNWRAAVVAVDPRPSVPEIVLAGIVALIGTLQTLAGQLGPNTAGMVACALGLGVAVLVARAVPLPAAALFCGVTIAVAALGTAPDNSIAEVVATIIVIYVISAWAPVWAACVATVAIVGSILLFPMHTLDDVLWESILMALPFVGGQAMRRHRRVVRRLEAATAELERSREERAAAAVTEDRMRVAREVHDVIAHSVSVMVVQATAAETTIDTDRASALHAIHAVQETGRHALTDLRGLLSVLRTESNTSRNDSRPPRLAGLGALAERFTQAGLTVALDRQTHADSFGRDVDLVVYRVAQESLTNALKHGGGGTVSVTVRSNESRLTIRVVNRVDAPGSTGTTHPAGAVPHNGTGHGIGGMRERVEACGGKLVVAPTGDGFDVSAWLPLRVADDA